MRARNKKVGRALAITYPLPGVKTQIDLLQHKTTIPSFRIYFPLLFWRWL